MHISNCLVSFRAIAIAASFFFLWSVGAQAAEFSIKIGYSPFYSYGLLHVAADLGLWKEEGLDAKLVQFGGGPLVNQALLGGSVDFGDVGIGPAVALFGRTDRVIAIVSEAYSDTTAPPELLIVRADSPIKNIKELDGMTVGVHAKGTLSHILVEQIKRRTGIQLNVLEIPASSQYASLSRGNVDAVMNETPFPEQMKAEGAKYIYGVPNKDVVAALAITQSLTTREVAEKNPEVVVKFAKVEIKAARWAMEHPEEAKAIITKHMGYSPAVIKLIDARSFKWSRNGAHLLPSIKWWGQSMQDLAIIPKQPDYEKYYVSTFLDAALKQLGKVPDPDFDNALASLQ
jgi:ABC-type nitrate/sulfonate/bicarbonate transport system substrate-binding protein